MVQKIDLDHSRFRDIVRGSIRKDLRRHIANGTSLMARRGEKTVSIPMPRIQLPRFQYGNNQGGGVGQGEGEPGDPVDGEQGGDGRGEAGEQAGEHELEVEVSLEELARILGEELELPNIQPKGKRQVTSEINKYTGIRRVGPASLRHIKRTFKRARAPRDRVRPLRPATAAIVIPTPDDMRYRSWDPRTVPQSNAVILYMMDVSGSMGDEQKEIVRIEAFWIDTWLQEPVPPDRDALHRARRRGEGSRPAHVLPPARVRRHQDLVRVRAVQLDHRPGLLARGVEHLPVPLQRRRQLVRRRHRAVPVAPARPAPPEERERVLLWPGPFDYGSGQFKNDLDNAFKPTTRT